MGRFHGAQLEKKHGCQPAFCRAGRGGGIPCAEGEGEPSGEQTRQFYPNGCPPSAGMWKGKPPTRSSPRSLLVGNGPDDALDDQWAYI